MEVIRNKIAIDISTGQEHGRNIVGWENPVLEAHYASFWGPAKL